MSPLVSTGGSVLAAVRGGGSSPHHLGLDGSMRLLTSLIDGACEQAGIPLAAGPVATVGAWFMAGADLPVEERALRRAVERLGVARCNHVMNDTFAVLRAGTHAGWGIAVVSGAGVNCVGLAPDGRTARFLALGDITGDWGGGADIGLAALAASVRAEDGRGPATALCGDVAAYFGQRRADQRGHRHPHRPRRPRPAPRSWRRSSPRPPPPATRWPSPSSSGRPTRLSPWWRRRRDGSA